MDLEFQKTDFDKIMFPILDMPDNVDPVKFFPKLQRWEQFYNVGGDIRRKNKLFRYIVLMYDKESPFRYKVNNLLQRKVEVAKYVKLVDNPKNVPEDVLNVFTGKNDKFNSMVIAYVRMHRDVKYALVVGLDNLYYSDLELIQSGNAPKKPIQETEQALESAVSELLSQDNDPQLQRELFRFMEEERLSTFRPEGIAEALMKGENPFEGKEVENETY